jgi:NAD-dependent SIR2 family protein deacetylase
VTLQKDDFEVMVRHQRALCHLRERRRSERIALFLGAGVSKPLGFPNWSELIERIERQSISGYLSCIGAFIRAPQQVLKCSRILTWKPFSV